MTQKDNISTRSYFQTAIKGNTYVSEVLLDRKTNVPIIVISTPVINNGKIIGIMFGVVNYSAFSEQFIDTQKIGENGYTFSFMKNGITVSHPNKEKVSRDNIDTLDFGKRMMQTKNGTELYEFNGVNKIAVYKTNNQLACTIVITAVEDEVFAAVTSLGRANLLVTAAVIVIASCIIFFITKSVVTPINRVVDSLKDAAQGEGDLTKRIVITTDDEVGDLGKWFNLFVEKIQIIIQDITGNTSELENSSGKLLEISRSMAQSAEDASHRANTVATASEEMSANMSSVAAAMEQATTNIHMVSSAAEEMTVTINEIANNAAKGSQITTNAVYQTQEASEQVGELGRAAEDIGKVIETITDISEQVNLLALNATIEAARAGEAGKGFAVVANEIKELAKQTAAATGEIKDKVTGIRSSTSTTVNQIREISAVVNEVNDIVSTIASAVEEQSATTNEIAGNVSQASAGLIEVNENVAQANSVTLQITKDITEVTSASDEISNSSEQVKTNALGLAELATQLNSQVNKFKV
ncbi:methyl-accepting chemotaxis sensory transducer with Cache sensor [Desulfopila aestuarii DSM 18488]|uniref:Methyl-accepting chemotaxis sensory transducer with Cache sensor n=2 Tax=Desulfopila aestuarii TaxID=231440 RepID=A0A1M7XYM4_9BACT|nr:methyl-accepting chemotaxis sensory transducer with Cache sensor [Desulfopila aestuarii DSM 18488]